MVSMKPGSGDLGLDPDFDSYSGSPEDVGRRRVERRRAARQAEAAGEGGGDVGWPSPETTRTRYGGPPPGTHGPWRWGQLVKGSPLEKVSVLSAS